MTMADLFTMFLLDISIIVSMLILAYMSKKMGDALKIKPYYLLLYFAAMLVVAAFGIDVASRSFSIAFSPLVSLAIRCCAGALAFGVCLRYWNWLFAEFFGF